MISKGKIAGLLALCSIATLTCGFSAWIVSENNPFETPDIYVEVGDVKAEGCQISFVKGENFMMSKNGFAHDETIQDKNYFYYDRSFSMTTTWMVTDFANVASLVYSISRDTTTTFPFFDPNYVEFTQTTYVSSSLDDKGSSVTAENNPSTFWSTTTISLDDFKSGYEKIYLTFEYLGKIKDTRTILDKDGKEQTVAIDFPTDVYDKCFFTNKAGKQVFVSFNVSLGAV